jgi:hypothetical protein
VIRFKSSLNTHIENGDMVSNLRDQYVSDYDHYASYRQLIISGQQNSSENIDKFVLTLSSASIGLVIAFLGKAIFDIQDTNLVTFSLLELGLLSLIGSLFFVIVSMLLSSYIYQKNGELCDKIMSNRTKLVELIDEGSTAPPNVIEFTESSMLRKTTQLTHYLSPTLLIIGVILIGLFFIYNTEALKHGQNTNAPTNATSTPNISHRTSGSEHTSATPATATESTTQETLKEIKMKTHEPKAPEKKSNG